MTVETKKIPKTALQTLALVNDRGQIGYAYTPSMGPGIDAPAIEECLGNRWITWSDQDSYVVGLSGKYAGQARDIYIVTAAGYEELRRGMKAGEIDRGQMETFICCDEHDLCAKPCLNHPDFQLPPAAGGNKPPQDPPAAVAAAAPEPLLPARRMLPSRRSSETFPIEADGVRYYATAGYYDHSRTQLGEVFLNTRSKLGSAVDIAVSEAATVASIAIQYGVPPEVIRDAMKRDGEGKPHGPLGAALDMLLGPPAPKTDPALP